MPFNYQPLGIPFKLSAAESGTSAPDYVENLLKGFKAGMTPRLMADELLKNKLQNQINSAKAKYAEQNELSNIEHKKAGIGLTNAQIQRAQADIGLMPYRQALLKAQTQRANQPMLSGVAKEAFALEDLKNRFGENSDVYQRAKQSFDLQQQSSQQLNSYRQALQETMSKRTSTNLGKTQQELSEIESGFMPGSNGRIPLTPEQQNSLRGQYELKLVKETSDVDTRKRAAFASNIDKTLDNIDVKDLTQYGGLLGGIDKKIQEGRALTGTESKSYDKFQEALTGAKLLAKQVRQFYGDSITPQIQEQLSMLTNPASWTNNPKIAANNFNKFKNILASETDTYRNLTKNAGEYRGKSSNQQMITIRNSKTGESRTVSLEEARKLGVPNV